MRRRFKGYEATKILLRVSRAVSVSLDLTKVSDLVLAESMKALKSDHASLFLLDEELRHLVLTRAKGFTADEMDNIKLLGSWEVINDYLVRKRRSFIVNDVKKDPIFRREELPFSREKIPIQSFLAVPLESGDNTLGALIVSNKNRPGHKFTKDDKKLLMGLSNHISISLLNAKVYEELKSLYLSTVRSLVRAVEAKDPYTSGHSERVMRYTLAIAKELKMNGEVLENLKLSSLLHDVGKIGIKDRLLSKHGRLTGSEKSEILRHASIGVKIVEGVDAPHKIIDGIQDHHERFDGKGYPNHLKGYKISLQGRIIAVADTYDALTTNRPYQKRCSKKEAVFEIMRNSSTQFDPEVVKAFLVSFSKHSEVWIPQ